MTEIPYYYTANGQCPPWFEGGKFVYKNFDPTLPYTPKGETYTLNEGKGGTIENPYDLRNLRIIDPEFVVSALEQLETKNYDNPRAAICVIATGGTIATAMIGDELVPTKGVEEIFDYVGRFYRKLYNYSAFAFPTLIDSSQMKLDFDADLVISMSYIWHKMSPGLRKNFHGFLISHGTDTFGPSLTRVAQMLGTNLDFSVAGVASQDNIEAEFNDVADNVGRAVGSLNRLFGIGRKAVLGYIGGSAGGAYNPNGMLKISDTDIRGFDSPAMDLIIDASNTQRSQEVNLPFQDAYSSHRHPQLDPFYPLIMRGIVNSRVIEAQMDVPAQELYRQILGYESGVIAVIAKTYGSFTFDEGQVDGIVKGARERGLLIFATNPFPTGSTEHRYSPALYLINHGAIPLHMLPHAAATKLLYGERVYGRNSQLLEAYMTSNNSGEQPRLWTPRPLREGITMRPLGQPRESIPNIELVAYP